MVTPKLQVNLMIDRVAWDLQGALAFFLVGREDLSLGFGKLPPLTGLVLIGGGANVLLCELVRGSVEQAFMGQTLVLVSFAVLL